MMNHEPSVSELQLLSYSYQVANGMDHLTSRNVIHRDVALRNVLLTGRHIIKIADFGLALSTRQGRAITDKETSVSLKWQAIESITDQKYTLKSDVWSFGVVLWEIFSFGGTPYPDMSPITTKDRRQFLCWLKDGNRMEMPNNCPNDIAQLILKCWDASPRNRPEFSDCKEKLKNVVTSRSTQYWGDLEVLLEEASHDYVEPQDYNLNEAVAVRRE